MVARAAMYNVSVLQSMSDVINKRPVKSQPKALNEIMREYVRLAQYYDMPYQNSKYVLCQMSPSKASEAYAALQQEMQVENVVEALNKVRSMDALWQVYLQTINFSELFKVEKISRNKQKHKNWLLQNESREYDFGMLNRFLEH